MPSSHTSNSQSGKALQIQWSIERSILTSTKKGESLCSDMKTIECNGASSTWLIELVPKRNKPIGHYVPAYLTLLDSSAFPVAVNFSMTVGQYELGAIRHQFESCQAFLVNDDTINRSAIFNPSEKHLLNGRTLSVAIDGVVEMPAKSDSGSKKKAKSPFRFDGLRIGEAQAATPPFLSTLSQPIGGKKRKRKTQSAPTSPKNLGLAGKSIGSNDCSIQCVDESGRVLDTIVTRRSALQSCSARFKELLETALPSTTIAVQAAPTAMRCFLRLIDGALLDQHVIVKHATGLLAISRQYGVNNIESLAKKYLVARAESESDEEDVVSGLNGESPSKITNQGGPGVGEDVKRESGQQEESPSKITNQGGPGVGDDVVRESGAVENVEHGGSSVDKEQSTTCRQIESSSISLSTTRKSTSTRFRMQWVIRNLTKNTREDKLESKPCVVKVNGTSTRWLIELHPNVNNFVSLYLKLVDSNRYPLGADITIAAARRSVHFQHTFAPDDCCGEKAFIQRGSLFNPSERRMLNDTFTVDVTGDIRLSDHKPIDLPPPQTTAAVKRKRTRPPKVKRERQSAQTGSTLGLQQMHNVFGALSGNCTDCSIECVDAIGRQLGTIGARRAALESCSASFRQMLDAARPSTTITIEVAPDVLRCFLRLIDGSSINSLQMSAHAHELWRLSKLYRVGSVQSLCDNYVLERPLRSFGASQRPAASNATSSQRPLPAQADRSLWIDDKAPLRIAWGIPFYCKDIVPPGVMLDSDIQAHHCNGVTSHWRVEAYPNHVDCDDQFMGVYLRLMRSGALPLDVDFVMTVGSKSREYRHRFERCEMVGERRFVERGSMFHHQEGNLVGGNITIVVNARIVPSAAASSPSTGASASILAPQAINTSWPATTLHYPTTSVGGELSGHNSVKESRLVRFLQSPDSDAFTDCTLSLREKSSGEELASFELHRVVLCSRSTVFRDELTGENSAKRIVVVEDLSAGAMLQFVDWFYERPLFSAAHADCVEELLVAAARYAVDDLLATCEALLCARVDVDSVMHFLVAADVYGAAQLKRACIRFWCDNKMAIITAADFSPTKLSDRLLKELLALPI